MIKAIKTQLYIGNVKTTKDGGIGTHITTPELNRQQKLVWLDMSNTLVEALLEPQGGSDVTEYVKTEIDQKTPSQRLRAVFYRFWEQDNQGMDDFEFFYRVKMEKIIDNIKGKIV